MVTQLPQDTIRAAGSADRLQQAWLNITQVVVLGLLVLALVWASQPPDPNNPVVELQRQDLKDWKSMVHLYRIPLGVFALASLIAGVIPALRRSPLTAALGGLTLGTACWLASVHLWQLPAFNDVSATIPLITPVVLGAALLLALLGLATRAGIIRGNSAVGNGALAAMLLLLVAVLLCYGLINYLPSVRPLGYEIGRDQLVEMLASVLLFLPAIWLGGAAIRRESRWCFQPLGTFLVLAVFFVIWRGR